jgi:hypothetical protein
MRFDSRIGGHSYDPAVTAKTVGIATTHSSTLLIHKVTMPEIKATPYDVSSASAVG